MKLSPIPRREVSDRTRAGRIAKWTFLGFNAVMLAATIYLLVSFGEAAASGDNRMDAFVKVVGIVLVWLVGGLFTGMQAMATCRTRMAEGDEVPPSAFWKRWL